MQPPAERSEVAARSRCGVPLAVLSAPPAAAQAAVGGDEPSTERYKDFMDAALARDEQVAEAEGMRLQERQLAATVGGLRSVLPTPQASCRASAGITTPALAIDGGAPAAPSLASTDRTDWTQMSESTFAHPTRMNDGPLMHMGNHLHMGNLSTIQMPLRAHAALDELHGIPESTIEGEESSRTELSQDLAGISMPPSGANSQANSYRDSSRLYEDLGAMNADAILARAQGLHHQRAAAPPAAAPSGLAPSGSLPLAAEGWPPAPSALAPSAACACAPGYAPSHSPSFAPAFAPSYAPSPSPSSGATAAYAMASGMAEGWAPAAAELARGVPAAAPRRSAAARMSTSNLEIIAEAEGEEYGDDEEEAPAAEGLSSKPRSASSAAVVSGSSVDGAVSDADGHAASSPPPAAPPPAPDKSVNDSFGSGWNPLAWIFAQLPTAPPTPPLASGAAEDSSGTSSVSAGVARVASAATPWESTLPVPVPPPAPIPRTPPGLRVERVNKPHKKAADKPHNAGGQGSHRGESGAGSHRGEGSRSSRGGKGDATNPLSSRSSVTAISSATTATASMSTATASNSSRGSRYSTGDGGNQRKQLRKDKHKHSIFTPREEEAKLFQNFTSTSKKGGSGGGAAVGTPALTLGKGEPPGSQQPDRRGVMDTGSMAATSGSAAAPAPAPAGAEAQSFVAPDHIEIERVHAAEQPRVFKKQALANACERMHSRGVYISCLNSSAAAGLPRADTGEGSPPSYRTQQELWDQPVSVCSLELAMTLGLGEEEWPEEVIEPERAGGARAEEEADDDDAPSSTTSAATATMLGKSGSRGSMRGGLAVDLVDKKVGGGKKGAADAKAAGKSAPPTPSPQMSNRRGGPAASARPGFKADDPASVYKRTHIDYGRLTGGGHDKPHSRYASASSRAAIPTRPTKDRSANSFRQKSDADAETAAPTASMEDDDSELGDAPPGKAADSERGKRRTAGAKKGRAGAPAAAPTKGGASSRR